MEVERNRQLNLVKQGEQLRLKSYQYNYREESFPLSPILSDEQQVNSDNNANISYVQMRSPQNLLAHGFTNEKLSTYANSINITNIYINKDNSNIYNQVNNNNNDNYFQMSPVLFTSPRPLPRTSLLGLSSNEKITKRGQSTDSGNTFNRNSSSTSAMFYSKEGMLR